MRKTREKKPLLHVFICDRAAYEREELIGGWLTLPASEDKIQQYLLRFSGQHLITDYDLEGSCLMEEWVREVVLCCTKNVIQLNNYIERKKKMEKRILTKGSSVDKRTLERLMAYQKKYMVNKKESTKNDEKR